MPGPLSGLPVVAGELPAAVLRSVACGNEDRQFRFSRGALQTCRRTGSSLKLSAHTSWRSLSSAVGLLLGCWSSSLEQSSEKQTPFQSRPPAPHFLVARFDLAGTDTSQGHHRLVPALISLGRSALATFRKSMPVGPQRRTRLFAQPGDRRQQQTPADWRQFTRPAR